jgi:FtsP/CotA-like multicopper oxidase with cupredoxin domain
MTWIRTQSRKKKAYAIPAVLVGIVVLIGVLTLTSSQPVAKPTGIVPLPQAVDINHDKDIFETALVAMEAPVDLGNGVIATAQTFNGIVPGPEIRLKVGDKVIVHFTNNLTIPSSIHWHGIELTNRSDGTGVTQAPVPPGGTFTYDFIARRPGIFFYHSHIDPTNPTFKGYYGSLIVEDPAEPKLIAKKVIPKLKDTLTLVLGDTTVCKAEGSNDTATFPANPALPWAGNAGGGPGFPGGTGFGPTPEELCDTAPLDEHGHFAPPVALPAGAIPNIQPTHECGAGGEPACPTDEGQLVLVNGKVPSARGGHPGAPGALAAGADVVDVKGRQGVRLQIASATAIRYFRLRLTCPTAVPCVAGRADNQIPLFRIGGQAGLLDNVRLEGGTQGTLDTQFDPGEILVAVSERHDVVFTVPDLPPGSVLTLWTLDYKRIGQGPNWARIPTVPVAHFRIASPAFNQEKLTIAAGDPLRTHPAINDPVENLKNLVITDHFVAPPLGELGTEDDTIALTAGAKPSIDGSADGHIFDAGDPAGPAAVPHVLSTRWAVVDKLLELTLANETLAHHPWHPHGFSIQPVRFVDNTTSATLRTFQHNEFVDSIDIPPGTSLVYRVRMEDRPFDFVTPTGGALGRWAMHCHILFHAGIGMITEFVVQATP